MFIPCLEMLMTRLLFALLFLLAALRPTMAAEATSIEAEETRFKVTLSDGQILRSPDLIGAVLTIDAGKEAMRVRIDAVERDPERGRVWLHTLSVQGRRRFMDQPPSGASNGMPEAERR